MQEHAADTHAPLQRRAEFRFYEELNDFLPRDKRKKSFAFSFQGTPSVKDTIEAIGVPHPEIDLILIDDRSVSFDEKLTGGERVAVYPVFERLDISPLVHLRPEPLRETRFILDVHLGALARHLRLLGFDSAWRNDLDDETIVERSLDERRVILTRDLGILRNGRVTHGYWLRSTDPMMQLEEVVRALDLGRAIRAYTRCLECNGELRTARRRDVVGKVPLQVFIVYRDFTSCEDCGRVYWRGSHQRRLDAVIERARGVTSRLP